MLQFICKSAYPRDQIHSAKPIFVPCQKWFNLSCQKGRDLYFALLQPHRKNSWGIVKIDYLRANRSFRKQQMERLQEWIKHPMNFLKGEHHNKRTYCELFLIKFMPLEKFVQILGSQSYFPCVKKAM